MLTCSCPSCKKDLACDCQEDICANHCISEHFDRAKGFYTIRPCFSHSSLGQLFPIPPLIVPREKTSERCLLTSPLYAVDVWDYLCNRSFSGIAFQSNADHPQMSVFSYTHMTLLVLWPWPWPDDLDISTWPSYSEDVLACQCLDEGSQKLEHEQDRQTDRQTWWNTLRCHTHR